MKTEMEAARDAAREDAVRVYEEAVKLQTLDFDPIVACYWGFEYGWNARGSQWVAVNSADDLPTELDWYEVTVKETSSLGTFTYVDMLCFGHAVDWGNCWANLPENGRVIAWRECSKPYTADSGQEGE
jgi:hypothetical protein